MRLPVAFASTLISFSSFFTIYILHLFLPISFISLYIWAYHFLVVFTLAAILATWSVLYDSEWHIRKAMHVSHFVLLYLFHFLNVPVFLHLYALRQPIRSHLLS